MYIKGGLPCVHVWENSTGRSTKMHAVLQYMYYTYHIVLTDAFKRLKYISLRAVHDLFFSKQIHASV